MTIASDTLDAAMPVYCWHCCPEPVLRREMDPRKKCTACKLKAYTPADVRILLARYRGIQDHGFDGNDKAALAAEVIVVGDTLRRLALEGRIKDPSFSALVNCCMLHQYRADVAAALGIEPDTVTKAITRGLRLLADVLNRSTLLETPSRNPE